MNLPDISVQSVAELFWTKFISYRSKPVCLTLPDISGQFYFSHENIVE